SRTIMTAVLLTDIVIRKLKAQSGRQFEVFDKKVRGLAVRVSPKGTKSFVLLYRVGRRARRLTFGRVGVIGLAEARRRAESALRAVSEGQDPAATKAKARQGYEASLFPVLVDDFIENYAKRKNRSWQETERVLKREFVPSWRMRPIQDITRHDL